MHRHTKPPQRERTSAADECLGNVVEKVGLNARERAHVTGSRRKHQRRANLIGALNEPDRQLWTERHHGPAPRLTRCRIGEIIRLEIVPKIVDVTLRPLIVHVQIAGTDKTKEWRDTSAQTTNARNRLSPCL